MLPWYKFHHHNSQLIYTVKYGGGITSYTEELMEIISIDSYNASLKISFEDSWGI